MLVKIYGMIDLLSGVCIAMFGIGIFPESMQFAAIILAVLLAIKSLAYIKDIASVLDLVSAILLLLAIFGMFHFVFYFAAIWLSQKGISSVFFS